MLHDPPTTPQAASPPQNRGITIRCTNCGLEVTGARQPDGTVRASDRVRPAVDAEPEPGLCITCAARQEEPAENRRATITHEPGGKAQRPWLLVCTLGAREVIRRRFLSRTAAIDHGASFLAHQDERYVRARLMAEDLLVRVADQYARQLDRLTVEG